MGEIVWFYKLRLPGKRKDPWNYHANLLKADRGLSYVKSLLGCPTAIRSIK